MSVCEPRQALTGATVACPALLWFSDRLFSFQALLIQCQILRIPLFRHTVSLEFEGTSFSAQLDSSIRIRLICEFH